MNKSKIRIFKDITGSGCRRRKKPIYASIGKLLWFSVNEYNKIIEL